MYLPNTIRTIFIAIIAMLAVRIRHVHCSPDLPDIFTNLVNISHPDCGHSPQVRQRIVSGSFAKVNQYPFYTVLLNNGRPFGGATIVNERWLLTAAHIVSSALWKNSASTIKIGIGSHLIDEMELYEVEESIPHPNYKADKRFDVGLIKLTKPLQFSASVYPVCFPSKLFQKVPSKKINVIGFGYEKYDSGMGTNALKTVILDVISFAQCRDIYSRISNPIWPVNSCTWTEGKDACLGDSGGPMFIKQDGRFVQWGVVSYGVTCADEYPGVFATITFFLHWIRRVIRQ